MGPSDSQDESLEDQLDSCHKLLSIKSQILYGEEQNFGDLLNVTNEQEIAKSDLRVLFNSRVVRDLFNI